MTIRPFLVPALVCLLTLPLTAVERSPVPTPAEADAIVSDEMLAERERRATVRERLREVPALKVHTIDEGDRKVVLRRVAPPVSLPEPAEEGADEIVAVPEIQPVPDLDSKPREPLEMLLITVYGDQVSRIQWGGEFTVWSATSFAALPAIGEIGAENAVHPYFAIVSEANAESLPDEFSIPEDSAAPYWLEAGGMQAPPDRLFAEMELLHEFYWENEEEFRDAWQRSKALREARERYLAANPPVKEDLIINFAPVKSRPHEPDAPRLLSENPAAEEDF